ncbi:hypothetical protein HMPREF1054_1272 [Haemophilus paraphrohaemolyticus HK411]|uniref:Uncharacterized protein n=1 Tax=Haemophilus paraphrohaemolyticus HK411 TaxID=1095743 RepID=I2NLR0_9PAST|nr:hypothetical protein HMPREF1054_1272 [Haemophilus paraphrohaemolyticus HK411]
MKNTENTMKKLSNNAKISRAINKGRTVAQWFYLRWGY